MATRQPPKVRGTQKLPVSHPCPIVRGNSGNHGDERTPLSATTPDRLTWSRAVVRTGFEPTVTRVTTVFKVVCGTRLCDATPTP